MTSKINLFLTGATGYIGGSVFAKLLEHKDKYNLSVMVRDSNRAKKIEEFGVRAVVASLDDFEKLQEEAKKVDVVIHTAESADHVGSCKALLSGIQQRHSQLPGGRKPVYIHTSGTGVLIENVKGDRGSDKVFNDDIRADTHENISDTALHRDVDFLVYEAGRSGLIDTYIICPPLIYGVGAGPFNRSSIQIPEMIKTSLKYGKSVHVGKGENVWSNVYVEDLANFYILILEKALKDEAPKNDDGYYFVESGTHNFKELAHEIGKSLVRLGQIKEATPISVNENDEHVTQLLVGATGSTSQAQAVKARKLGWKPTHFSLFDLDDTVQQVLNDLKKQ